MTRLLALRFVAASWPRVSGSTSNQGGVFRLRFDPRLGTRPPRLPFEQTPEVGAQREYLLDICAQGSADCFDEGEAEHVSCCCAYSPLAFLGQQMSLSTIPGVSAIPEGAWVKGGRRLSDSTDLTVESRAAALAAAAAAPADGVFDICAEAWTTAVPAVAELRQRIGQTGFDVVISDYIDQGQETYGGHFCDYSVTGHNGNGVVSVSGGNGVVSVSGARARSMPGFAAAAALLVLQARWGPQRTEAVPNDHLMRSG